VEWPFRRGRLRWDKKLPRLPYRAQLRRRVIAFACTDGWPKYSGKRTLATIAVSWAAKLGSTVDKIGGVPDAKKLLCKIPCIEFASETQKRGTRLDESASFGCVRWPNLAVGCAGYTRIVCELRGHVEWLAGGDDKFAWKSLE